MDYNSLIAPKGTAGSLANWVNFSDAILPLADIVADAQTFIYERLRLRYMRSRQTLPIPLNAISVALPSGLLDVISLADQYQTILKPRDVLSIERMRTIDTSTNSFTTGQPGFYTVSDESFQFDIASNIATSYVLVAYFQPALLTVSVPTNFLTSRYPHLLRAGCLMFAADFLNDDPKYNRYMQRLTGFIDSANQTEDQNLQGKQVDPSGSDEYYYNC